MADSEKPSLKSRLFQWIGRSSEKLQASGAPDRVRERFERVLPRSLARSLPSTFEPAALAEWAGQAFQGQSASFYGKLLTVLFCTFFLADLTAILADRFIPEPPSSRSVRGFGNNARRRSVEDYSIIWARNLFNSMGRIPGEETPSGDRGGAPVRTTLPLNLIGTLILKDELKSIATIEDRSAQTVYPVRQDDEIPTKARILKIEARKVIFINTATGQREFIDMPEENIGNTKITVQAGNNSTSSARSAGPGIEKLSPTQFNVSRSEVDKALSDFNNILTQARAVPNFENGVPAGYKLFQIVPGSIYDKLGLQNGDTICGLNGQGINDPGKAFEMLGELKTSSHMELCIKRDGRTQNFAYDIR